MKKFISLALVLCLAISLIGCSKPAIAPTNPSEIATNPTYPSTITPTGSAAGEETMIAVSVPTTTENTTADNGTVLFQYTYQNLSLVLHKPDVADKIILDFLTRIDSTSNDAKEVENMAKSAYNGSADWTPYMYHLTYSPTRIDPTVLSFFGNNVVFSGASHPDRTCVSVSYDLETGDVLTLASIMTKTAKAEDFCNLVLEGLSSRAEGDYLYENYAETVKQRFTADPSRDEAWYFTQTGLNFYFAPYEIAPYTSGVISVEISYEKLQNLLFDEYLPTTRQQAEGSLTVTAFGDADLKSFSHISELIADQSGEMFMVSSTGHVQNIQITYTDTGSVYTVFAAYALHPGDGIMIQATDAQLSKMELQYESGDQTVKIPIVK